MKELAEATCHSKVCYNSKVFHNSKVLHHSKGSKVFHNSKVFHHSKGSKVFHHSKASNISHHSKVSKVFHNRKVFHHSEASKVFHLSKHSNVFLHNMASKVFNHNKVFHHSKGFHNSKFIHHSKVIQCSKEFQHNRAMVHLDKVRGETPCPVVHVILVEEGTLIRVVETITCLHMLEIKTMSTTTPKDQWAATQETTGAMHPKDKWDQLGLIGTTTILLQLQELMGRLWWGPLIKVGLYKMDLGLAGLITMEQERDMGKDIDLMVKIKGLHRYQMSMATHSQWSVEAMSPQDIPG